jgi:hypothetical protein
MGLLTNSVFARAATVSLQGILSLPDPAFALPRRSSHRSRRPAARPDRTAIPAVAAIHPAHRGAPGRRPGFPIATLPGCCTGLPTSSVPTARRAPHCARSQKPSAMHLCTQPVNVPGLRLTCARPSLNNGACDHDRARDHVVPALQTTALVEIRRPVTRSQRQSAE